ncbi:MAG: hypothetical protein A3I31_00055 [Candidatus Colwellbacteria bacterium RIFCSPLOWO2_02_FULL_44_20b]|uniref:Thioredoxin domain-containing protein n=2 Tax=Candidatus Colwelliibacteriota TaxID=1817904 RepID=A0A1G1Z6U8_9BACT|nr:MAG: hypothetical protein A3I31_00055 [Candidatus Colwellbacteria bacterium RIFCSPLOWO2_02_FULL_44_20b]
MDQQFTPSSPDDGEQLTKKERKQLRRQEKLETRAAESKKQVFLRVLTWGISLIVLAGVVVGLIILAGKDNGPSPADSTPTENVSAEDWVKGPAEAPLTLIEYGDFQCPACASYHSTVELLMREFGDDLRFVYRHFPLTNIHKQAELAAYAAEAAGKQGKFWEMYDLLFNNQEDWAGKSDAKDIFLDYAKELKLTLEQFEADLDLAEIKDKVEAQLSMGQAANVNATPTFYLNGTKIATNPKYEEFKDLLTLELTTPSPEVRVETQGEEQSPNGSSAQ